jgi:CubicO group peptidase (beta-lactamase class C family)
MDEAIREGKIPGAVLLIGHQGKVIYRKAFGFRALRPRMLPMTEDTIFDIASLTKVVATTTAVMQLAEDGKLQLDAPVARYWPAFQARGKGRITVRQLLTHYSGLRPDLRLKHTWSGYRKAMKMIIAEKPVSPPGSRFLYSDINFEILGELVRRVSGKTLDVYCSDRIFRPLGMIDTGFRPSTSLRDRVAPTRYRTSKTLCGEVHDPTCLRMGGVAGHAGLFSTVDDLSVFSQMLLNGGSIHGVRILSPTAVEEMTTPQSPPVKAKPRGLGWDLDAPLSSNREALFPVGSYGHLGYTGTAIWIDPVTQTFIILLTNRVHMDGGGDVEELRAKTKKIVADAIGTLSSDQVLAGRPSLKSHYEIMEKHAVPERHTP